MADVTVKGLFILQTLKMLHEELPADQFAGIEADLGIEYRKMRTSYFKDYPVDLQVRVEEAAARALWGRSDDDAFYKFGELSFKTFAESTIGKTLLVLVGKNPNRMLGSAGRMIEAVAKGMETEIKQLEERKYSFRFRNNPYRIQGWQGLIESCLRHTGVEPKTEVISHGGRDTEYIFEW